MFERQFLIQKVSSAGTCHEVRDNEIANELQVINFVDYSDIYDWDDFKVYEITNPGEIIPLTYKGWQPGCLIEFTNDKGEVVLRGYGTDH